MRNVMNVIYNECGHWNAVTPILSYIVARDPRNEAKFTICTWDCHSELVP